MLPNHHKKVSLVIRMQPWVLGGLNVVRSQNEFKPNRTSIIERYIIAGLKKAGLTENSHALKIATNKVIEHELEKAQRKRGP